MVYIIDGNVECKANDTDSRQWKEGCLPLIRSICFYIVLSSVPAFVLSLVLHPPCHSYLD